MDRPQARLTPPSSPPSPSTQTSSDPPIVTHPEPDRRNDDEIRAGVVRERERMDLRLAELRGRLEPSAMAARSRAAVAEKARRRGRTTVDAVRLRPLAASLVAGGTVVLVAVATLWRRR